MITRSLLVLAVLSTIPLLGLASPHAGIHCIYALDDGSLAATGSDSYWYISEDGGLTWEETWPEATEITYWAASDNPYFEECWEAESPEQWLLADPHNEQIAYRFRLGESIERSEDGGQTWIVEADTTISEAQRTYYRTVKELSGDVGPVDAIFHESTGHLIVAMASEGILLRTPAGGWHQIALGSYQKVQINSILVIVNLLARELIMAVVLLFVCAMWIHSFAKRRIQWEQPIFAAVSTIFWIGPPFLLADPPESGLPRNIWMLITIILLGIYVIPVFTGVLALGTMAKHRMGIVREIPIILILCSFMFIAPFVLWTQDVIHQYTTARSIACGLALVTLLAGILYLRRRLYLRNTHPIPA